MKPREFTTEEVREQFLSHVVDMVNYWSKQNGKSDKEKLSGLAFSILVTLDGEAADLPGFIVAPCPHESDEEYCKKNGMNWFPCNSKKETKGDIAGSLHDLFHRVEEKRNS